MASTTSSATNAATSMSSLQQGEMLQALAYSEPPIAPAGLALALIIVILITIFFATLVTGLRVYVRAWTGRGPKLWGWEDTFLVLGYCALLVSSIFAIKASFYGLGTRDIELNPYLMVRCAEYMLYSQVTYGVSMPLIKAAVVFMLLNITQEKFFRWALWSMQAVATIMAIVGILASLLYCHPVRAYWNPLLGTCGDFMTVVHIGYAWTAVGIVTDLTCAILPYFVVRKLQMSSRSKTTVMVILGMGTVASLASIIRAPYLQYYLVTEDRLYWNGYISLWCQLESGLGLIAACLPALRKLFRRYLDTSQNRSAGYGPSKPSYNGVESGLAMDRLGPASKATVSSGKWERLEDEYSSASHIVRETTVSVETGSLQTTEEGKFHNAARAY